MHRSVQKNIDEIWRDNTLDQEFPSLKIKNFMNEIKFFRNH